MYIEQVIEACDTLYPNPYTLEEKYFWCDELSELLTVRYNTQYVKSELTECGGRYLLPPGVTSSMLDSVICGNDVLKKQDFRTFGILCCDRDGRGEIVLPDNKLFSRVYAIYILPYEKIRNIDCELSVSFLEGAFVTDENIFRQGDVLDIKTEEKTFENVYVLDVEVLPESGKIKVFISSGDIPQGDMTVNIKRHVTEQTVCPPPYDSMYIDYVLGKICYYQNDFAACNNHMTLYNSKLSDYEKWLKSHPIVDFIKTKFKNWW